MSVESSHGHQRSKSFHLLKQEFEHKTRDREASANQCEISPAGQPDDIREECRSATVNVNRESINHLEKRISQLQIYVRILLDQNKILKQDKDLHLAEWAENVRAQGESQKNFVGDAVINDVPGTPLSRPDADARRKQKAFEKYFGWYEGASNDDKSDSSLKSISEGCYSREQEKKKREEGHEQEQEKAKEKEVADTTRTLPGSLIIDGDDDTSTSTYLSGAIGTRKTSISTTKTTTTATVDTELIPGKDTITFPCADGIYMLFEQHTGTKALTACGKGEVRLEPAKSISKNVNKLWLCIEEKGYIGFQNVGTGKYLGHRGDGDDTICACAQRFGPGEFLVPRAYPNGNFRILSWDAERLMPFALVEEAVERRQHSPTWWRFVRAA